LIVKKCKAFFEIKATEVVLDFEWDHDLILDYEF
jgi:hypothetical protein